MTATVLSNQIAVRPSFDGAKYRLTIDVPYGWDDVKKLTKKILSFEGRKYTFIGWNSDRNECFFIESEKFAKIV